MTKKLLVFTLFFFLQLPSLAVVNNDGTNYFSGTTLGGNNTNILLSDILNIFSALSVNNDVTSGCVGWTPVSDNSFAGGVITQPDSKLFVSSDIVTDGRFSVLVKPTSNTAITALVGVNSSNNLTEFRVDLSPSGFTSANILNSISENSPGWAVSDGESLSYFRYEDQDNYIFVSQGLSKNPDFYTLP